METVGERKPNEGSETNRFLYIRNYTFISMTK